MEPHFRRLYVLVSCCTANQYTESTSTFLRFQTHERILRFNKSKIKTENTFNGNHFEIEVNLGLDEVAKILFWVLFQICDQCFNPYTANYVYLRFS